MPLKRIGLIIAVVVGAIFLPSRHARADERADAIKAALEREIIGPRQAMAEVATFVEERVPRMPSVKTAEEWDKLANQMRADVLEKVVYRGAASQWRDAPTRVEWGETIPGGAEYHIKKLRFEALPGLWVPALLYEPEKLEGKVPVVLNVNGHDAEGKAAPYKQTRCINFAKRGMLALNLEWYGMGQLRSPGFDHGLINAIDLCGSGGVATHYLAMKRGLDILLAHEHADPTRVGVAGLSGGGWQTIFFSSLESRVTLTNPVAGYSSFITRTKVFADLGDSEQTPCDLATVADYCHLTAMMAPRVALLTFNAEDDCCFAAPNAMPLLVQAAAPMYRLHKALTKFHVHINTDPGTHNFQLDNRQALYKVMADSWSPSDHPYPEKEIACENELKKPEELQVPLPADNLDFQKIALNLAKDLPRKASLPDDKAKVAEWQKARREKLRTIVKPFGSSIVAFDRAPKDGTFETKAGISVQTLKLRIGEAWTVPAVRFEPADASNGSLETVLVLADGGRKETAEAVEQTLAANKRAVVIDVYYFGECKMAERDYLWPLMIATVGERPLGVEVGQVLATARSLHRTDPTRPVSITAIGPRTSLIALTAASIEPELIRGVALHDPPASLKERIEKGQPFATAPEAYCFGLLEAFDVKDIAALVAPHTIQLVRPSDRARSEFEAITQWAQRLGL